MKYDESPNPVDKYITDSPLEIQSVLQQLRTIIRQAAPEAEEVISYGMPAYRHNGILVYFGAQKKHIGFYPTASGIENFKQEFTAHKYSKGAVQFPYDKPLPVNLIERIVKFRMEENLRKKGES